MTTKGIKSLSITLFDTILNKMKSIIQDEDNVEKALQFFPYFDTWNRKTVADCCRLSKIRVIPPDGIVLGSEEQESSGVHFIMEGTCKLIEHLSLVQKKTANGRMKYLIFHDKNIDRQISAGDEPKYSSLLFNMGSAECWENEENRETETEEELVQFEESQGRAISREPAGDENEEPCGTPVETIEIKVTPGGNAKEEKSEIKKSNRFSQFYRRMLPYMSAKNRILCERSSKVESHFMQIALVHKGCCLGLGENLRNRFLVSVTKVTCMVIPLQFLLQHNPNNIWNRIKQFLNDYLPKEEEVLSEFVINKKWNECKRKLVTSKSVKNTTKMSDVPISIRLSDANMRLDLFQRIFIQPV